MSTPQVTPLDNFRQRITFYSTAALAAGVSMLALAQPVVGEVVTIHKTLFLGNGADGSPPVQIDFNNDGAIDISFNQFSETYGSGAQAMVLRPPVGAGVITKGMGSRGPYVSALLRGAQVGPSAHFNAQSDIIERTFRPTTAGSQCGTHEKLYGHFPGNIPDRFIGVKFLINGATHYGWVRMSVDATIDGCFLGAKVTAYAYETVANKKITIGSSASAATETEEDGQSQKSADAFVRPSLGMLALGADGLSWRRKEPSEIQGNQNPTSSKT
ncbi:MAG TPA: hypothetical protein VHW45_19765 [Candidatus Sulfotelmatobacter sp.]|jgi:hypothetical protein|nr:hypothetical protein [Candidatus Sulfotelmatobacter sp.]